MLSMNKVKHPTIVTLLLFLLLSFVSFTAQAQNLFQRKIHITDSVSLVINATARTPDGGVLIGANQLLFKVASGGTIEWIKRLRTDSANLIAIAGLSVDSTGDIIFTGKWFANAQDLFFGRCSSEGILQWYKVYDLGGREQPEFQIALSDGSFLVGGETAGDSERTFLIKFNIEGDVQWTSSLVSQTGKNASPTLIAGIESPDHSIFTVGSIYKHIPAEPEGDIIRIHVDHYSPDGKLLEKHTYGIDSPSITAHCLLQRKDGSLVVGGEYTETFKSNEPSTPLLLSLDSQFHLIWNTRISFLSASEGIRQLIELNDGRLLSCTSTDVLSYSLGIGVPCHIGIFSSDGQIETLETIPYNDKALRRIFLLPTVDNNYIGLGLIDHVDRRKYDLGIFSLDSGLKGCNYSSVHNSVKPITIFEINDPQILPYSFTPVPLQRNVVFSPFKIDSNILICSDTGLSVAILNNGPMPSFTVHPNPAPINAETIIELPASINGNIKLTLKDVSGKTIYTINRNISSETRKIRIPLHGFASGIYFIEIVEANSLLHQWRQKLVVE